jgi:type II secretory pathway component PulM
MQAGGWVDRIVLALSGITLVLVIVYLYLVQANRAVQAEVNQRQQFINQSIEFNRINDTLIRTIATTAVNDKDQKLRDLLTQSGITINPAGGVAAEKAEPPESNAPAAQGK